MGLFRSRARKNRENAAARLLTEQTGADAAVADTTVANTTVAELMQADMMQADTVLAGPAQADAMRRDVIPEARPNPDQPGWGRTIGQAIGKARQDRQE